MHFSCVLNLYKSSSAFGEFLRCIVVNTIFGLGTMYMNDQDWVHSLFMVNFHLYKSALWLLSI